MGVFRRSMLFSAALWVLFAAALRVAVVPPESCGAAAGSGQDPAALERAALAAVGWMMRNQQPDGRYTYIYYAGTDTSVGFYNDVRHAGVTMSLYQAAGRFADSGALAAADRGLAWMRDHLEYRHGWAAIVPPDNPGYAKLGSAALMAVGLTERRLATGDTGYDGLLRELGRFIVALQREDGSMSAGWQMANDEADRQGTSRYYTGEAFWALTLLHNAFPDEGWDIPARKTADYLATRRDDVEGIGFPPWADQWAAYGLAEMADDGLSDAQIAYARGLAGRFGLLVRTEAQRQAGSLGTFVRGGQARAAGAGTWVEGLAALWRLASSDARMADLRPKIEERLACAAGILAGRQVDEAEAAAYPQPGLALGAWFRDGETRMDDQQHAFSGLLYTLDALSGRTERAPDAPTLGPGGLP